MRVTDLRAEYTTDLLGTQVAHPRLSWRIEDAEAQSSYRIRAAVSEAALSAGDLLWDSGAVASDATFDIAYGGPALKAMQRVWWTVEADGVVSDPAWFEAGLFSPEDWRGDWIEAEDEFAAADRAAGVSWVWGEVSLDARPHAFRIDFDAPADLVRAEMLVAGKDHLRGVWVNGAKSPLDWHFDWDTYLPFWGTLAPYEGEVRPGRNSVCALVEADTQGFFPVDGGAFAALIRLHRADGSIERITGSAFRVMPDAPQGWTEPGFDAGGWAAVVPSTSWAQGDPRPSEPAMLLRTGFDVLKPVASARLYATALGTYDARINGQKVSEAILAPEITVAKNHILYQTHDVTDLIAQGENALGAVVGDGFYASPFGWRIERYGFGPAPRRFRAMLRIDYADGTQDWVVTGPDWKIATSPILKSEIYDGETFDARRIVPGWALPGFDASGWADVKIGAAPNAKLIAQTSPLLERNGVCRAVSVSEPVPGRFVFDFGQNFPGWVRIRA
ncbi:MAG TPA: alpha-L-rhamnosidase N-terminal domain-containing protein, partial [Sphingomonas sp.]|nr:alpha-L-rhamnosidase N-terminal domain-containing protein [Sphingomonas sp.]